MHKSERDDEEEHCRVLETKSGSVGLREKETEKGHGNGDIRWKLNVKHGRRRSQSSHCWGFLIGSLHTRNEKKSEKKLK
jgi:hypothetical protein